MSNRKPHCPYRVLGRVLEDWRRARFRSALAMFRDATFSFSYNTYADYERGALLPDVESLIELAKFFKVDERPAVLCWAEVQMPNTRLRGLFSQAPRSREPESAAIDSPGPSFENTWVFGPQEREAISRYPWFFELCQRLVFAHPRGLSHRDLGFGKQAALEALVRDRLKPWIAQGRMAFRDRRLYIVNPHLHLPKTGVWKEVRQINLDRALATLGRTIDAKALEAGRAAREIITRTVTDEQIESWVSRLRAIEDEFKAMPYVDAEAPAGQAELGRVYSQVVFFGERVFRIGLE